MIFRVKRTYRSEGAYHWEAEIREEIPGGGWEGSTVFGIGEPSYVFALTRLGLRIEVKRKCRQIKREERKKRKKEKPDHKAEKEWRVEV